MALGDDFRKTSLTGERSRRSLESGSGAMRRAARRLRRKGYSKASEKMALDAEQARLGEKAQQGSGFRSAEAAMDQRDIAIQQGRTARALAAGFRPPTRAASGELLEQRKSLFEEMKAARAAGNDVESFRDRATGLGVTSSGFEKAMSRLPAEGAVKSDTPESTTPTPEAPTKPAGPNAPAGGSPVQGTTQAGPAATKPAEAPTGEPGIMDRVKGVLGKDVTNKKDEEAFNPVGTGYDYASARKAGLEPDESGHWSSRDPETGLILKGTKHPTFQKTLEGERKAGMEIYRKDGRLYSRPRAEGRIDGLPASLAMEITGDRADIATRTQSLLAKMKDMGMEGDPDEISESLKRKQNVRHRDQIYESLSEVDPKLASKFATTYESSVAVDPDSDPMLVLRLVRESMEKKKVDETRSTGGKTKFDQLPASERADRLLGAVNAMRGYYFDTPTYGTRR